MAADARDMKTDRLSLSVVVASHNAHASIEVCLSALAAQHPVEEAEIIVVDNSTDGTTEIIRQQFPHVRLVVSPPSVLIPELWAIGIRQTKGDIVALTTAHCVPAKDWLSCIRQAHESPAAAVGGAIENLKSASVVDWAVYLCRYSRYMLPLQESFVSEIAGDNASYKRAYLDRYPHTWRQGFWEPTVHAEFRRVGLPLLLAPSIVVCHMKSFGLWSFIRQRFQHGIRFGQWRASHLVGVQRIVYRVCFPVIPFLLLARIGRQVLAKRRHRRQFLVSLPLLVLFLLSWAAGEVTGSLRGLE